LTLIHVANSFIQTQISQFSSLESARKVDWVCGAAMLLRQEVRTQLAGDFDPSIFLYGEDEDL
jgi:GT2 family glycosyltransferase